MSTSHSRLFAAMRPFRFTIAATAAFVASVSLVQANPHILVDVQTGRVLEHEEAFRKWYPASLTKLMTVYTVFDAIRAGQISLDTPIVMSKRAAAQPAAKMYFKPGQKLTLDSALKILMVKSANDIAVAVAEAVGGTQEGFVTRMNGEALKLGMTDSHFVNPNGLPGKGQYTTARDLAVLTVALRRDFPQYAGYFSLEGFTTGQQNVPNLNMLIGRFAGADGMKTGFICASGFNQIGSATRNGRTLVSVVLGTDSLAARADATANLLQKGFTTQFPSNETLGSLKPYGQGQDQVADISADICSAKGAKIRSETRDEVGRMKVHSPYILEMDHDPQFVFAGLIPGQDPQPSQQPENVATGDTAGGIANVPVPLPRPTSF
ncbi:D-alanyl-D-alanine carboxypeptidase family protein [Rhizobium binae]|uniref:D-alanyl-D-alanine carboxypeptidase n=1 Tax=Rhizobium binae TaxID=1138190 RepID=A0ABV2MTC2_9HYPH|nr:D-alanyl-D-alanine carboxypeptidase family protein [Rhizobium binae]NKL49052.1 D-alanyl-D-alanine carboxypeptidase [Rhizobium leguminosarum bv. viciae]MBX4938526.1 D-alanyl-D-alanine carboxypeptidase [Rhizobium binae]MBX4945073.1 D-alanyl-D-alanine carboxypeptidase [Rhizobium binae]MBX4950983.1 D-alanyl-D-alanine carboxypeptidase [Rhizobium binae]MBX4963193.1 D-alanyl-D-alanine carboxypeptidase [Rhizobium binae]